MLKDTKEIQTIFAHFGTRAQILKTIEELSELQQALVKELSTRNEITYLSAETVGEMADVLVMLSQLAILTDIRAVERIMEFKINRTLGKIRENENRSTERNSPDLATSAQP